MHGEPMGAGQVTGVRGTAGEAPIFLVRGRTSSVSGRLLLDTAIDRPDLGPARRLDGGELVEALAGGGQAVLHAREVVAGSDDGSDVAERVERRLGLREGITFVDRALVDRTVEVAQERLRDVVAQGLGEPLGRRGVGDVDGGVGDEAALEALGRDPDLEGGPEDAERVMKSIRALSR